MQVTEALYKLARRRATARRARANLARLDLGFTPASILRGPPTIMQAQSVERGRLMSVLVAEAASAEAWLGQLHAALCAHNGVPLASALLLLAAGWAVACVRRLLRPSARI